MGPCVLEIAIILKIKKPFLFYGKTFFCSHCIILSSFHLLPLTTRTYKSILSLVLLQCENVHHVKTKEPGRELLIIFRVSNQNTFKAYPVFFLFVFFASNEREYLISLWHSELMKAEINQDCLILYDGLRTGHWFIAQIIIINSFSSIGNQKWLKVYFDHFTVSHS